MFWLFDWILWSITYSYTVPKMVHKVSVLLVIVTTVDEMWSTKYLDPANTPKNAVKVLGITGSNTIFEGPNEGSYFSNIRRLNSEFPQCGESHEAVVHQVHHHFPYHSIAIWGFPQMANPKKWPVYYGQSYSNGMYFGEHPSIKGMIPKMNQNDWFSMTGGVPSF